MSLRKCMLELGIGEEYEGEYADLFKASYKLQAENKRLREVLIRIANGGFSGASFIALEALKENE